MILAPVMWWLSLLRGWKRKAPWKVFVSGPVFVIGLYTNSLYTISFIQINLCSVVIFLYEFTVCCFGNTNWHIHYCWLSWGMECMRSKKKRKIIADKKSNQRKHKMKQNQFTNARWCVTKPAASADEQCLMRIQLILSSNK